MKLTKQQQSVMDRILYFLESDASVFVLKGYAGTGKTTMVKEIVKRVQERTEKNDIMKIARYEVKVDPFQQTQLECYMQ